MASKYATHLNTNAVRPISKMGGIMRHLGGPIGAGIGIGTDVIAGSMEGLSPMESIGRGMIYWAAFGVLGVVPGMALLMGVPLARAAGTALPAAYRQQEAQWRQYHQSAYGQVGGGFADTEQAMTMRQSAIQAIQGSRMNARSALGNEASLMHR